MSEISIDRYYKYNDYDAKPNVRVEGGGGGGGGVGRVVVVVVR